MHIGKNIKSLRYLKGITQEQLADKLNISAQAVSKWETETTLPDITLLPQLSVLLGVTIDELFTMTDESQFERIDNMLYDVRFLSETEFSQTEQFLIKKYNSKETKARASLLLCQLYNKRAKEYHQKAAPLARCALLDNPDSKDAHNALFEAEGGAYQDWNFTNHHQLIEFYKAFTESHPDNFSAYLWLLDLFIDDGRCSEAALIAEKLKALKNSYHYELAEALIAKAKGKNSEAQQWLDKMVAHEPKNWQVYFAYANQMAKQSRYDDAINYYQKARPLRPTPRFIDAEEALSQIYEIKGDYQRAIEMQNEIIRIMKSDWSEFEGEGIEMRLREIKRLKQYIQ